MAFYFALFNVSNVNLEHEAKRRTHRLLRERNSPTHGKPHCNRSRSADTQHEQDEMFERRMKLMRERWYNNDSGHIATPRARRRNKQALCTRVPAQSECTAENEDNNNVYVRPEPLTITSDQSTPENNNNNNNNGRRKNKVQRKNKPMKSTPPNCSASYINNNATAQQEHRRTCADCEEPIGGLCDSNDNRIDVQTPSSVTPSPVLSRFRLLRRRHTAAAAAANQQTHPTAQVQTQESTPSVNMTPSPATRRISERRCASQTPRTGRRALNASMICDGMFGNWDMVRRGHEDWSDSKADNSTCSYFPYSATRDHLRSIRDNERNEMLEVRWSRASASRDRSLAVLCHRDCSTDAEEMAASPYSPVHQGWYTNGGFDPLPSDRPSFQAFLPKPTIYRSDCANNLAV